MGGKQGDVFERLLVPTTAPHVLPHVQAGSRERRVGVDYRHHHLPCHYGHVRRHRRPENWSRDDFVSHCSALPFVSTASGFLICRLGIGLGLATFVACQFWMSVMFNGKCVGIANATAAGWGNLGGGVTQFVMPLVYAGMLKATEERAFTAWRWAYIV